MIKVVVGTSVSRKEVIVDPAKTPKQVLSQEGIDFAKGGIQLDGAPLSTADMNTPLAALGIADDMCYLISVAKADSGAKLQKSGNGYTLKTDITKQALEDCKRLEPTALTLLNEDKKPVFMVDFGPSSSIGLYGITFNSVDEKGKLFLTHLAPNGPKTKEEMSKMFATELDRLVQVEKQVIAAEKNIAERVAAVASIVEVLE